MPGSVGQRERAVEAAASLEQAHELLAGWRVTTGSIPAAGDRIGRDFAKFRIEPHEAVT
jgi:hypothetical protein